MSTKVSRSVKTRKVVRNRKPVVSQDVNRKPVVKRRRRVVTGVVVSALLFLGLGLAENANAGTLLNDLTANTTTLNTVDFDLALLDASELSLALDHLLGLNDALKTTTLSGLRPLSAELERDALKLPLALLPDLDLATHRSLNDLRTNGLALLTNAQLDLHLALLHIDRLNHLWHCC